MKKLDLTRHYPVMEIAKRWNKHFYDMLPAEAKNTDSPDEILRYNSYDKPKSEKKLQINRIQSYLLLLSRIKNHIRWKQDSLSKVYVNAEKKILLLGEDVLNHEKVHFGSKQIKQQPLKETQKTNIEPIEAPRTGELNQNSNKNDWELTESEYTKLKAYELIPLIMKSLNINPMNYPPQHNKSGLKKEIHTKGFELFKNKFRMSLESFSRGSNSAWSKAKNNNLIREEQKK